MTNSRVRADRHRPYSASLSSTTDFSTVTFRDGSEIEAPRCHHRRQGTRVDVLRQSDETNNRLERVGVVQPRIATPLLLQSVDAMDAHAIRWTFAMTRRHCVAAKVVKNKEHLPHNPSVVSLIPPALFGECFKSGVGQFVHRVAGNELDFSRNDFSSSLAPHAARGWRSLTADGIKQRPRLSPRSEHVHRSVRRVSSDLGECVLRF